MVDFHPPEPFLMAKTLITSIGIEWDAVSIRAAKIDISRTGARAAVQVSGLSELRGDFSSDENLSGGMKKIREKISITASDRVVTTLAGKQVYVAQLPFRKLPDVELRNALKLEIKKSLPFEVAGATIDYQMLEDSRKDDTFQFVVTAVPGVMVSRHLHMMERLGMKPWVVDVFPLSIANAFHLSQKSFAIGLAYVIVHVGSSVVNLVVCGDDNVPFFHRSIYFSSDELFGDGAEADQKDIEKRLGDLADEIGRSLSFYEKTFSNKNFAGVFLEGEFLENESIARIIGAKTSLTTEVVDVFARLKQASNAPKGKFEVAMGLAMRNAQ
jgi:Tfp pilus assembly PilM family ATPase